MNEKEIKSAKELYSVNSMLAIVSGETTVSEYELGTNGDMAELWRNGATLAELIDFVNENY